MKNSKNKLLATVVLLTTILAMTGIHQIIQSYATNYTNVNSYCWVEGVFDSDSYVLYPYAQESLDVGFSKYGEMIGYNETSGIGLGLQYPGYASAGNTYDQTEGTSVDPFANEEIDIDVWMNGWFIDVKYRKATGEWREIWAFALFSDGALHGGDWITVTSSTDPYVSYRPLWQEFPPYANPDSDAYPAPKPSYGGRKSNGVCVTDPITIVYNGPRKYVAVMKTRVSDGTTSLVDLYFTLIFNKADKNVILLKDVKRLYDKGPLNVQFGNRGEWDLSPPSYVHFYTDEPVTSWDVNNDGAIDPVDEGHEFFFEYMTGTDPISGNKAPKKWWDEIPESEYPEHVGTEEFSRYEYPFNEWFETQYTCYGREWHTDETIKEHSYAVAQIIDSDAEYVGALAVWPHPEFWSVQNSFVNPYAPPSSIPLMLTPISRMLEWHRWLVDGDPNSTEYPHGRLEDRENVWVKVDDMSFEPDIPFIIYEHDFKLALGVRDIYRIVSVYVLTDWHDADDYDADDLDGNLVVENKIDREIQYQLDEIFDPYDIYDAMHQNTKRWVQFFDRDYEGHLWNGLDYYIIELDYERQIETGEWIPSLPVYSKGSWDAYCNVSERVLVNTGTGYTLIYPVGYNWLDPTPNWYSAFYEIDPSTGVISFWEWDDDVDDYVPWCLPTGSIVKVEWSSEHNATTAGQWDAYDLLYPLDGTVFRFPLHHDVIDYYKPETEVFLITTDAGSVTELVGGDYVFWNKTKTIYMQDPVPAGQWLMANYTIGNVNYTNFWKGDGTETAFTLQAYPDEGSLVVRNTDIIERIENTTEHPTPETPTPGEVYRVPKTDCWKNDTGGTFVPATPVVFGILRETEWLNVTDTKVKAQWIIRETSTCDELVIDYTIIDDLVEVEELKIVFKVPSGRWEWGTVGKAAASVDSLGIAMVTAAFKNKLIEFGLGGLDIQDTANGPRIPWLVAGTADCLGRYHLYDDWCYSRTGEGLTTSWPISSSNIITVGGNAINNLAKYSNDWIQALVTTTPKIYSTTCWNRTTYVGGDVNARYGYAIISTYKDKNGTAILLIAGWTGQDTYYACKWFDVNKYWLQHLNLHVTDLVLKIEYKYSSGAIRCVPVVTIAEKLGTISEKPQHDP